MNAVMTDLGQAAVLWHRAPTILLELPVDIFEAGGHWNPGRHRECQPHCLQLITVEPFDMQDMPQALDAARTWVSLENA